MKSESIDKLIYTELKLRVSHFPQIPCQPFIVDVNTLFMAKIVSDALANYDLFQFDNNIKPDYCNATTVEIYEDGEWVDWIDDETGMEFDDLWEDNNE